MKKIVIMFCMSILLITIYGCTEESISVERLKNNATFFFIDDDEEFEIKSGGEIPQELRFYYFAYSEESIFRELNRYRSSSDGKDIGRYEATFRIAVNKSEKYEVDYYDNPIAITWAETPDINFLTADWLVVPKSVTFDLSDISILIDNYVMDKYVGGAKTSEEKERLNNMRLKPNTTYYAWAVCLGGSIFAGTEIIPVSMERDWINDNNQLVILEDYTVKSFTTDPLISIGMEQPPSYPVITERYGNGIRVEFKGGVSSYRYYYAYSTSNEPPAVESEHWQLAHKTSGNERFIVPSVGTLYYDIWESLPFDTKIYVWSYCAGGEFYGNLYKDSEVAPLHTTEPFYSDKPEEPIYYITIEPDVLEKYFNRK